MEVFQLTYLKDSKEIIHGLNKLIQYFKTKNMDIGISESMLDKTHFINIYFSNEYMSEKTFNMFQMHIANILYKVFVENLFDNYIYEFVNDTYFFLDDDEIREIKIKCKEILQCDNLPIDDGNIYYLNEKNDILNKILECVKENNNINIDGFMTFRTKELKDKINSIIEKIVEEHMVEKEYKEFIKLLKYFVNIQESKIDEINIFILEDGSYSIIDKEGNDITEKILGEFLESDLSLEVNKDDVLISGLITYCPKKIVIHNMKNCKNKEVINTIKNVFPKRVFFPSDFEMYSKEMGKKDK